MQSIMFYGFSEPCYTITSTRARHPATDKIINRLSLQFMDINPEKSNQGHRSAEKGDGGVIYCRLSPFMDRKFAVKFSLGNEGLLLVPKWENVTFRHELSIWNSKKEYNDKWILFKQWADEGWIRDPDRVSGSQHDNEANNNYKSAPSPSPGDAWPLPARALGTLIRLCLAPGFDIWTFAT